MAYHVGVKPGKAASFMGMIVGLIFVLLGVFLIIPTIGAFGVFWTAVAGAIALFYAVNLFSRQGLSAYDIDVDSNSAEAFDESLRKLAKLKADGLISDSEYRRKRAEIMGEI